jgi:long-chain acyl-CoA synthetase
VTALIVLDDEAAPLWAQAKGLEPTGLASNPVVLAELESLVEQTNSVLSRVEQVKKFEVLGQPWTPESGEVTPTLKLRRRIITDRYREAIEKLYE